MAYEYPISKRRNNLTLGHPHLWKRYGTWHCSSAGAKATGSTQREAYYKWVREERFRAQQRAKREARTGDRYKSLR